MKKILFLLSFLFSISAFATGTLTGTIKDAANGEPIPFANIIVEKGGSQIAIVTSDFDGKYIVKGLEPGRYDVKITYVGYGAKIISEVLVSSDQTTYLDIEIKPSMETLDCVEVVSYKVNLISKDRTTSGGVITSDEISRMPGRDASSTSATVGGVYVEDGSSDMCVRGSRADATAIYIDGVKLRGSASVPKSAVDRVSIITSGLPAKYENAEDAIVKPEDKSPLPRGKKKTKPTAEKQKRLHRILTAGELNDFSKWELWADISENMLNEYRKVWQIAPEKRYMVQVCNTDNKPIVDCSVNLIGKNGRVIWRSKTDNTGKAELWASLFEENDKNSNLKLVVKHLNNTFDVAKLNEFEEGINKVLIPADCSTNDEVDLAFVVDATASMGDEINYLKAELKNIIKTSQRNHPELYFNLGSVFYRDHGDEYVTKISPFSTDIDATTNFIKAQYAAGGGDFPEAVDLALLAAVNELQWNDDARARMLFIVLDAPPHASSNAIKNIQEAVEIAAEKGIRIIPITASGIDKSTEYLMRSIALATNGTYVFLTNHSGVGNPHIKPTTDKFQVELLNDLLLRLIYQYTYVPACNEETVEVDLLVEKNIIAEEIVDADLLQSGIAEIEKETSTTVFDEEGQELQEVGTNVEEDLDPVKYFPNPANNFVNIETQIDIKEFYLTDISGKILEKIEVNKNHTTRVNISSYPSGIYFFRYKVNHSWQSGKVLFWN